MKPFTKKKGCSLHKKKKSTCPDNHKWVCTLSIHVRREFNVYICGNSLAYAVCGMVHTQKHIVGGARFFFVDTTRSCVCPNYKIYGVKINCTIVWFANNTKSQKSLRRIWKCTFFLFMLSVQCVCVNKLLKKRRCMCNTHTKQKTKNKAPTCDTYVRAGWSEIWMNEMDGRKYKKRKHTFRHTHTYIWTTKTVYFLYG